MANNNTLTQDEQERLVELGKVIKKLPNTLRQLNRIQTAMGEYLEEISTDPLHVTGGE